MHQVSDPVTIYMASLRRQLRLDPWTRQRILAEIEDHLREAETSGRDCGPDVYFGDHKGLARDLMMAWLQRRCVTLRFLLVIAAVVTALAMFAINTLMAGGQANDASPGAVNFIDVINRGAGLIALGIVAVALLAVRAQKFDLGTLGLFTRLAGTAALLLGTSVAGEIFRIGLRLPSIPPHQFLLIAAVVLAETIAVSLALGMWGLSHRILVGLK